MSYDNDVKRAFALTGGSACLQLIQYYHVFQRPDLVGMSGKRNDIYEPDENYVS